MWGRLLVTIIIQDHVRIPTKFSTIRELIAQCGNDDGQRLKVHQGQCS